MKQTGAVEVQVSLEAGTSLKLQKTDGTFANTCTQSALGGKTSTFTGTAVSGPLSSMTFNTCTTEKVVVDRAGSLSFEALSGTTTGTVRSVGAELAMPSPFGALTCRTGEGTDLGTLTGKASGAGTIDLKAVVNCGILAPSAIWEGSYTITSPEGLGITS